jgi:hypothetical protein
MYAISISQPNNTPSKKKHKKNKVGSKQVETKLRPTLMGLLSNMPEGRGFETR